MNAFANLSAEREVDSFAQMTPEEHAEYQAWIDERRHEADLAIADDPRDSAGDVVPDDVDGSGTMPDDAIDHGPDGDPYHDAAAYDGGGWPGDGSGTDDLADMNANEADDYLNE